MEGMTQEDYQEQYDLCVKVQELQGKARVFLQEIDSLMDMAEKQKGRRSEAESRQRSLSGKAKSKYKELSGIRKELVTDSGPYPQPMLISQIGYLMSMISRVDQKPGKDAYIRLDELNLWLEKLQDQYNNLK